MLEATREEPPYGGSEDIRRVNGKRKTWTTQPWRFSHPVVVYCADCQRQLSLARAYPLPSCEIPQGVREVVGSDLASPLLTRFLSFYLCRRCAEVLAVKYLRGYLNGEL